MVHLPVVLAFSRLALVPVARLVVDLQRFGSRWMGLRSSRKQVPGVASLWLEILWNRSSVAGESSLRRRRTPSPELIMRFKLLQPALGWQIPSQTWTPPSSWSPNYATWWSEFRVIPSRIPRRKLIADLDPSRTQQSPSPSGSCLRDTLAPRGGPPTCCPSSRAASSIGSSADGKPGVRCHFLSAPSWTLNTRLCTFLPLSSRRFARLFPLFLSSLSSSPFLAPSKLM